MPNPLEILKKMGSWASTPMVDEESIAPIQDAIDSPSLDRSPGMARLQGFGAGAIEGLRGMTSPMNLAMSAIPALGALRGAGRVAKAAGPTLDLVEPSVIKQVAPAMDDVDSLIGDMQRNLARVPNRRPPMETLGEQAAEFTPRGGEGIYNVARQHGSGAQHMDPHQMLMMRGMGGRGR